MFLLTICFRPAAYMLLLLLTAWIGAEKSVQVAIPVPGGPATTVEQKPGSPGVLPAWIQSTLTVSFLDNFWLSTAMVARGRERSSRRGSTAGWANASLEMV